jgi:peptidoglycan/xylan/chitin deacetylase (PgdA/CDA1 family)
MRVAWVTGALAAAFATLIAGYGSVPPAAQPAASGAAVCADPGKALGVVRTVEIDTSTGPRFGGVQYGDHNFLQDGEVVLTFDDGPMRAYTRVVLDALDEYCTKATFFMVGRMAIADPAMVQMVAQRGHTIGAHTWSHQMLGKLSPAKAKDEIELGFSAIQQALGRPIAPFFRFPYLSAPKTAVAHLGARQSGIFSIDVDSSDFRTRDPKVMIRTVLSQLQARRKGILLFHDIQRSTAGGIRTLLGELKARGFKVVHVVPKAQLVTLAEYDARVGGEASRRRAIIAKTPLAERAIGWPMSEGKAVAPKPGVIGIAPAPGATSPPPIPTASPAPVTPASAEPTTPRPKAAEAEDWRSGVFVSQ